jgi:hypothetical protein
MTTPDSFEDRLLVELRHVVAATPAPGPGGATAPAATPRRPLVLRPARLALGGAGLATAAAVVAFALPGGGAAAYAVTPQGDGAIKVTINALSDAAGLEAKLRAAGIDADVDYSAAPPACPPGAAPPGTPQQGGRVIHREGTHTDGAPAPGAAGPPGALSVRAAGDGSVTFEIPKGAIPKGAKVRIATAGGNGVTSIGVAVTRAGGTADGAGAPPPGCPAAG